jgi:hypothetical protein
MLTMVHTITKWRPYLIRRWFIVCTDQNSLAYVLRQRIHTPIQERWLSKLLGYDYYLVYKKGLENGMADALSRQLNAAELATLSVPTLP